MRSLLFAAVLTLAGARAVAAEPALPTAEPIVAAERAFAADGAATGVDRSFLKHSTEDSIMIAGEVTTTRALMDPDAVVDPAQPPLVWFPAWAGISRSGDLGFTSGPVERDGRRQGHYFTIWQRQADGGWKWIYDGGVGATSKDEPGPDREPVYLATAVGGSASPEAAMAEVRALEARFAAAARTDQKAAHQAVLADAARLYAEPHPPGKTTAAIAGLLEGWPKAFTIEAPLGGGSSRAGDLVWTYGALAWNEGGDPRRGHYVHLWQKQASGWKLVFAQHLPASPPRPAPAAPTN